MIGEIRDRETAKIAVEAALTGHLVLTTVHARNTVNCIYRLMDLSITIDELRQSLVGIVAQTLVHIKGQDERKAIFELLKEEQLIDAIVATMRGDNYTMPEQSTLSYTLQKLKESVYVT